jgi:Rrf2 family transcriptional regulator, cysteine metabolism repressor
MRFTVKAEYGVKAILELAAQPERRPLQVRSIAKKQGLPVRFLEHVMNSLKKAGLVESIRGAHGGYLLNRSPKEISLGDVLKAIDGPMTATSCISDRKQPKCEDAGICVVQDVWAEVKSSFTVILNSITLQDMYERKRKKERQPKVLMFHI